MKKWYITDAASGLKLSAIHSDCGRILAARDALKYGKYDP
jgi:hypothetical protein